MNRRKFATAAAALSVMGVSSVMAEKEEGKQQFLELRKYQTLLGSKKGFLDAYLKEAAIPAWNRLGIKTVGVFDVRYGLSDPSVFVLLPHPTLESVATTTAKLLADEEYCKKGEAFLNASINDPAFFRIESSLMRAFQGMPQVEVPDAIKGKKDRIFEMRIYESHTDKMAKKKIEMFNEGKEIEIFRKTGLFPVFFGETLIGPRIPNLTYMLAFESMEQRDANWKTFVSSKEWKELSSKDEYKDTVSNISDIILSAKSYSQI